MPTVVQISQPGPALPPPDRPNDHHRRLGFRQRVDKWASIHRHLHEQFWQPQGSTLGFFGASMSVGGIIGCIVGGPLNDRFGRRPLISGGALLIVGMVIMQTFSSNFRMFTGGKLLLGFGAFIQQCAASVLVVELVHPKQREALSSFFNTNIYIGFIIGAWITFGTFRMMSQWSWKLPCILQLALPAYQVVMVWFCPESPRWLISKGRIEEARQILIKYHGNGVENEIIRVEMEEIMGGIEADKTMIKANWQGLKTILGTKGNRHRLWICIVTAVGSQALGGSFVTAYLPQILDQVGLTSSKDKTLINGIMTIVNWLTAIIAAFVIPKVKRRTMFLFATTGMTASFIIWTALTAEYVKHGHKGLGIGVVVIIFIYNFFTSMCWVPLVIAYPLENVTTKQRAIFFAITLFSINVSAFCSSYLNPVGLAAIGWRYYLPQCCFNALMIAIIYFTFVETKGLTLEEIAIIYDGKESFEEAVHYVSMELNAKHSEAVNHVEGLTEVKA
ncbi:uncharacterized protein Z519_04985 [Cladophialophora bantiana CBS 173.52]|uniref:Major facilitator superfamily (MFS) profile domain-containing protein n=1 Tax=Cladophialophora bantiana (strain ATCC 10958 / CBS 173.52 / CDC B-1940 / NIH 8579) TaxID=1442370 RepID=A0A0D2HVS1_CLAB1|nr:uncharacterized protein Z519_04985 [Cladophialophora bantiana CBS 173.52]KIW95005.1 hypothetical protein Z519_04985 [Cladophialophora bantiana CBS 173.52]